MAPPPRGARPPSQAAYYVALGGVIVLLFLLCCYFLFFCIKKIKELSAEEYWDSIPTPTPKPAPSTASYPIQPGIRDSATAMAKLCRQLPSQPVGGTVFPAEPTAPGAPAAPALDGPGKVPAPAVTVATVDEVPVR